MNKFISGNPKPNPSNTSSFSKFLLPLRNLTVAHNEKEQEIKGITGLNLLYQPSDVLVDLVFVHGLGGGSRKTWSFSDNPEHFWPRAWLSRDRDFKDVRIHSFGYDSDWTSTKEDISNISDFAASLLNALSYSPTLQGPSDSPIIFVAHSMGGLVVKKAYLLTQQDEAYKGLASRVRSMVFLATPHRGADSAPKLNAMLTISFAHHPKAYIDDLTRNSGALQTINDDFRHAADSLQLFSFYETVKTNIGGTGVLIVDRGSATLDYKHERHMPVQANHRGICKYQDPTDPNYKSVRDVLSSMVHNLEEDISISKKEIWKDQRRRLKTYLGILEKPEDDLESLRDSRASGSCEWITSDNGFQHWRDEPCVDIPQYLWLSAKPATGKSVLASYVIGHLEDDLSQDVSYFFFTRGHKFKSWLGICLRSIAFQMALVSSEARDVLLSLQDEDVTFNKEDARSIWRKLFIGGILRIRFQRPYYWVIDALDECNEASLLLSLLAKAESASWLRIFITTRTTGEISTGFHSLKAKIISIDMSIATTSRDIEAYVSDQLRALSFESDDARQDVVKKILNKASGCFLWVKLVLEKLRRVHTSRAVQKVLDDVPADMDELYQEILEQMSENRDEREFIMAVLTWAVCAIRPLTVDEFREALKLDIKDEMITLKQSIEVCCGQLVYIDSCERVQLVHETARKFLMNVSGSDLLVSRSEGNRRLLEVCLNYLSGPEMDRRHRMLQTSSNTKSMKKPQSVFALYASSAFPEHLRLTSASHSPLLPLLVKFLKTNILIWVEFVATNLKSLHHIMRAARSMKGFIERRAKYSAPLGGSVSLVESWTIDLIRLVTKFGKNILDSPQSVNSQVPPLCPRDTTIYRQFAVQQRSLEVIGLSASSWDDRISCIAFRPEKTLAVACGEVYFAVGVQNTIVLYHVTSCQEDKRLEHGEDVHHLTFNGTGDRMASSGLNMIQIWDVVSGDSISCFENTKEALALAFSQDDQVLLAALRSNHVTSYSLADGTEIDSCPWQDDWEDEHSGEQVLPTTVAFNQERSVVAVVYRGRSISLWDLEENYPIGRLLRNLAKTTSNLGSAYSRKFSMNATCEDIVFSSCTNLLAACYADGELCVFDADTREVKAQVDAQALALACSPDGQTLACGELNGSIQLRSFETLELLYKISTWDDAIVSLAFSADGFRFLDIRGSSCNIWEPAVLVRADSEEQGSEGYSLAILEPAKTVESRDSDEIVQITAIASMGNKNYLFVGNEEGVVSIYDKRTGLRQQILYRHAQFVTVLFLEWNSERSILISSDISSRFIVSKVEVAASGEWSCQQLSDQRLAKGSALKQLLLAPLADRFLVSSWSTDIVWSFDRKCINSLDQSKQSHRWINHPRKQDLVVSVSQTSTQIFDWGSFEKVREIMNSSNLALSSSPTRSNTLPSSPIHSSPIHSNHIHSSPILSNPIHSNPTTTVKHVIRCPRGEHLIVALETTERNRRITRLTTTKFASLDAAAQGPVKMQELTGLDTKIEHLIGAFDSKIVFLDRSLWVCTIDLDTFWKHKQYARHFFLPMDWMSTTGDSVMEIDLNRDLILAKKDEIAIIKRGFSRVAKVVWLNQSQVRPPTVQPVQCGTLDCSSLAV